jgi:hypothetical protein
MEKHEWEQQKRYNDKEKIKHEVCHTEDCIFYPEVQ